ncbi:TPA: hypothetical protein I8V91_002542 [Corynebacterium striatum]|nr:hypothetical protein [Corynebacterium striatum]HAT1254639.1 hypothetical protein [Corynebacterium striatum]HAT1267262.1 hypothetical protein [Corynebacterium striatum]HAT1296341.1 hypothetical protein [Corynebacterium striatum]HAT1306572.1 hypothetical protein [Corynebacterium striatum]
MLSSDGFHIESHIDSVPALARVKNLHGGLSSGQQALSRIVQSLLADADGLDGIQLYALSNAIESYRDAVIEQETVSFKPSRSED